MKAQKIWLKNLKIDSVCIILVCRVVVWFVNEIFESVYIFPGNIGTLRKKQV